MPINGTYIPVGTKANRRPKRPLKSVSRVVVRKKASASRVLPATSLRRVAIPLLRPKINRTVRFQDGTTMSEMSDGSVELNFRP